MGYRSRKSRLEWYYEMEECMEVKKNKKYRCGLDVSSIGYFCLLEGNKIISICQVPQKIENKELSKLLTTLKKDAKIKGNKTKCEREIKLVNDKILNLPRDCSRVFEWLSKYKDDIEIVNIEKPLLQTFGSSSIISLTRMAEYMGVVTTMLDILNIPYNIISISEWRSKFDFKKMDKEEVQRLVLETKKTKTEITREFAKSESLRIALELVDNLEDFYITKGKKINSDVVESVLLGLI